MTMELSTLTADEQKMLEADRARMGGGSMPTIPLIRLVNKDMKQGPEGEYFTELRKGKDEEPEITPLGAHPQITILYKTNTWSYYTPEDGMIAWTSDVHAFSPLDNVTLYRRKNGKVEIEFDGAYPNFKSHIDRVYTMTEPSGRTKKLMKFRTVLYVLFNGQPHKIFVSNASAAGVKEGKPSFGDPQALSLQAFTDRCWKDKRAFYEFSVTLGSAFVESSKPYFIMQFETARELTETELVTALRASKATEKAIYQIDDMRKASILKESEQHEIKEAIATPEHSVQVEDLPW